MDQDIRSQQIEVCRRYGSEYVESDPELKVGIALDTIEQMPIHGVRLSMGKGTTGWYIWGGNYSEAEDFYKPLCAAHLPAVCPLVIKYLGLAPGWRFLIDNKGYEDVWYEPHYPK